MDCRLPFVLLFPFLIFVLRVKLGTGLWIRGLLTDAGNRSLEKSGFWVSIAAAAFGASNSLSAPPAAVIVTGAALGAIYGGVKGAP
jgi:hypothetical protein